MARNGRGGLGRSLPTFLGYPDMRDDRGVPPRIVALPGTLCPPGVLDRLVAELGADADVHVVDWLAEDGAFDLESIAERLAERLSADAAGRDGDAAGPVVVLGHSTGGAIALRLALDHPELLAGLVLVDTGSDMRRHGDVRSIIDRVRTGWGPELRASVLDRSFAAPLDPVLRREWLAATSAVPMRAVHEVLTSQAALDMTAELGTIALPTVVVHGEHDRSRSIEDARQLADGIAGARLVVLPTGHTPMHEAPAAVADVVRSLLDALDGSVRQDTPAA